MKKIKILGSLLTAVALLASACKDDFLEKKRDLGGVNEEVYQQPLLAQQYVDYIYGMFLPANNAQAFTWSLPGANEFSKTTMELPGETNWNKPWATINYTQAHALNAFGTKVTTSLGNNTWTRLRQINMFLDNVDKYQGLDLDLKKKLKGQLFFWRAWQYFDLVRLYGGVPLELHAQNPIQSDGASLQIPRSKTSDCIKQITSDLDSAMNMLPGKWSNDTDFGRITSGAAAAVKGRVLLTWASPLFNRTNDQTRWKIAYDANKIAYDLLVANGAGLNSDWANMWFAKGSTNPEAVITFNFNVIQSGNTQKNNGWEQAIRPKSLNGAGSVSPTKQAVDLFPMKDGKMPGVSTKYPYDLGHFYKNRDPRFYNTFAYNGSKWPYSGNSNFRLWTYKYSQKDGSKTTDIFTESQGTNATGIYVRKASDLNAKNSNGNFNYSSTYFMEMRFAEVVLNLAECAAGINNLSEANTLLTSIRARAGIESADNYGLGNIASQDEMFASILKERRIEFAYEGKIFWDLRRWMMFDNSHGTLARLGMTNLALNGTKRTGYFITVMDGKGQPYVATKPQSGNAADPLIGANAALTDREPASVTDATWDAHLDDLYTKYFKVTERTDPDPVNPSNWVFSWYDAYYFFGLNKDVMDTTPYLEQTKGWPGINGDGTFDPLL